MKGQVTIFIILGFLILFVFGFLFFIILDSQSSVSSNQVDTSVIVPYLQSCLDSSLVNNLELLGEGGGFLIKGAGNNPLKLSNPSLGFSDYVVYDQKIVPVYFYKDDIFNNKFARICMENQPSGCSVSVISSSEIPCDCTCNPSVNDCENSLQNYLELSIRSSFISCYNELPDIFPGFQTKLTISEVSSLLSASTLEVSLYSSLDVGNSQSSMSLPPIYSTPIKLSLVSARRQLFSFFQTDLSDENFNFLKSVNDSILGVEAKRSSFSYSGKDFWITELVFSNQAGSLSGKPFSWFFATEKRDLILDSNGNCLEDWDDVNC